MRKSFSGIFRCIVLASAALSANCAVSQDLQPVAKATPISDRTVHPPSHFPKAIYTNNLVQAGKTTTECPGNAYPNLSAVVRVHINSDLFLNLPSGTYCKIYSKSGTIRTCVASASPAAGHQDDNLNKEGMEETLLYPPTYWANNPNQKTPLDIELSSANSPPAPTPIQSLWDANYDPIMLKFILDKVPPGSTFGQATFLSPDGANMLYALHVNGSNGLMFRICKDSSGNYSSSPDTSDGVSKTLKVLVFYTGNDAAGTYGGSSNHFGSLNIGIVLPVTAPGLSPLALPVYIDPQVHNNG